MTRSINKERIGAVILENTFTSIPDVARILFPFKIIHILPGRVVDQLIDSLADLRT